VLRVATYILVALTALTACDEKRMGRSPEKKTPPPVPYQSHYSEVPTINLRVMRMSPGENQYLELDGGVTMAKWDDTVVDVTNVDGGVRVHAIRQGSALIQGTDQRGVVVSLPVQVFPPLK
jgi:hypothetical protein